MKQHFSNLSRVMKAASHSKKSAMEMDKYIIKMSNNERVNLTKLSAKDLRRLHYEEECWIAEKILKLPPFSLERNALMNKGYNFVIDVKNEYHYKEHGRKMSSMGTDKINANLLSNLVLKKLKQNKAGQTVLYEAGVGMGFAIRHVLSFLKNTNKKMGELEFFIKGCDIYLSPDIIKLTEQYPEIDVVQGNAYDCIKNLPENSIDVFYADNVLEHFCPDEIEAIICEIGKKLKSDAYVFLNIPNKYIGPSDVSKYYLPFGSKAKGFHFMEMSFNEITKMMNKYKIIHSHCVFRIPKIWAFCIRSKFLIKLKLRLEPVFAKIPTRVFRCGIFRLGQYNISIMKKTDVQ